MPLDRLLSVVVLSPAQASLVAVQLLDATHAGGYRGGHLGGTVDGADPADAGPWSVALLPSGDLDVDRAPTGEGTEVAELLEQLSRNARRLPAHPRSEQLVLLRRLEDAAAASPLAPQTRARELEGALAEVLGSGARQRLSGQLAALVAAFARIAPSVAVPVAALASPGGSRPGPHRAAPTRSASNRPPRRGHALTHPRARTRRRLLVALLLAAAVAATSYVVLRSPSNGITGALGRDNTSPAGPSRSGTGSSKGSAQQPRSRPRHHVQTLAARHAGPVTALAVHKTGSCRPGSLCPVSVTVHVRPASSSRSVAWKVGAARWCGRGVTWSPPTTVTARPGWSKVYASSSVRVPHGRSLAIVALTTAPARAQSSPIPVTRSLQPCAAGHAQR